MSRDTAAAPVPPMFVVLMVDYERGDELEVFIQCKKAITEEQAIRYAKARCDPNAKVVAVYKRQ